MVDDSFKTQGPGQDSTWGEYSLLVLNELKRLNQRLDSLEHHLQERMERTFMSFKQDQSRITDDVIQLRIDMEVMKKDVGLKTVAIAMMVSFFSTIIAGLILKYLAA